MKKWLIRTIVACVALVALVPLTLLVIGWPHPEPRVNGRTLSDWLVQLRDSSPAKRAEAAEAVRAMGPEAVPYLTGELTRRPNAFQRGAEVASRYAPGFLKPHLARVNRPVEAVVNKHMALQAIGLLGTNGAPALPVVGEVLRQPDVGLVSAAAQAMIGIGTNSLPELIAALDDGSYDTRAHACYALAALRDEAAPAVPRLAQIIMEERGAIAASAATTLAQIGEPALPVLTGFLNHTNAAVRHWGAYGLMHARAWSSSSVPALIRAWNDMDAGVRAAAVSALARIDSGSAETATVILKGLDDPNADVRAAAADAGATRPRLVWENMDRFRELLEDESPEARAASARAIAQTGHHGQPVVPELIRMLEDTNATVRDSARYALGTITNSVEFVRGGEFGRQTGSGRGLRFESRDQ